MAEKEQGQQARNTTQSPRAHEHLPALNGEKQHVRECVRSSGEAVAALGAAVFENFTTCTSAHAVAKTVLFGATTIVWLEGTLHGSRIFRMM